MTVLDPKDEFFAIHKASLTISDTNKIYSFHKAKIALFKVDEACTTVFLDYSKFADLCFVKPIGKPVKHKKTNDHIFNLIDDKELSYR